MKPAKEEQIPGSEGYNIDYSSENENAIKAALSSIMNIKGLHITKEWQEAFLKVEALLARFQEQRLKVSI
jgi:hypothetical protein